MNLARPLAVLALAVPAALLPATAAHAACDVTVQFAGYQPNPKQVAPGTTVTWCWNEDNHSVTFDLTNDSGVKDTGATYSRTFSTAGTYAYHCTIHSSMQGTIKVGTATTSPPTHSPTPTPTHTTEPPTHSPTPARTTAPPATTPPPSRTATPSATPARTTSPAAHPTSAVAAPTATAVPTSPSTTPLADRPAKPKTGLAIGLGLVVAAVALGGAAWLFVRGR